MQGMREALKQAGQKELALKAQLKDSSPPNARGQASNPCASEHVRSATWHHTAISEMRVVRPGERGGSKS